MMALATVLLIAAQVAVAQILFPDCPSSWSWVRYRPHCSEIDPILKWGDPVVQFPRPKPLRCRCVSAGRM
jgi:hypothetical protein